MIWEIHGSALPQNFEKLNCWSSTTSIERRSASQDLEYSRGMFKQLHRRGGRHPWIDAGGAYTTWFTRAAQTPVFDTMLKWRGGVGTDQTMVIL